MRKGNSVQVILADTGSGGAYVNQSSPASNTRSPVPGVTASTRGSAETQFLLGLIFESQISCSLDISTSLAKSG